MCVSFLIHCDSGGGSSAGVNIMREAILEVKQTKPVYALIQKGGMACSAMYGIIAACNKIYSEDGMNMVGSTGTMIQFDAKPSNSVSPDGTKNIRLYATKSIQKNKAFEEAVNNDNYELLINNILDPVNENFLNNLRNDRPLLVGSNFEDGGDMFAKDAVGTYIDGIKSFKEVVAELSGSSTGYKFKQETKNNINQKPRNSMTLEELRQQFPETYQSIFAAGAQQEKDRVGTWMAHFESDPDKVRDGIKAGNVITATEREELLVKATANASLKKIENGSAPKVVTKETVEASDEDADEKKLQEFYKDL